MKDDNYGFQKANRIRDERDKEFFNQFESNEKYLKLIESNEKYLKLIEEKINKDGTMRFYPEDEEF